MQVQCIKEFHSSIFPEINYGVLGEIYDVEYIRYGRSCEEPIHYKFFASEEWVNAERFKVIVIQSYCNE